MPEQSVPEQSVPEQSVPEQSVTEQSVVLRATGPGPFITRVVWRHSDGRFKVATSRRHRKRLSPVVVHHEDVAVTTTGSWRRLWAPTRLAWWVAVLFVPGSALFTLGGVQACSGGFSDDVLNRTFFIGSLFFTGAAGLQWLEVMNGDVRDAAGSRDRWHWITWRPRNLGYLAGLTQFAGTLLFNVNTADEMIHGLDRRGELLLIWAPNALGSVCFLAASCFALVEVCHRFFSVNVTHLSWWIAVINMIGSVAFALSAVYAFQTAEAASWSSAMWTAVGGACFLVGAYLLLPEMFDETS